MAENLKKGQHWKATSTVLALIDDGIPAIRIAEKLKVNRATISKKLKLLMRDNLIEREFRSSFVKLKLTRAGKAYLRVVRHVRKGLLSATSEEEFNINFRLHYVIFRIPILRPSLGMKDHFQKKGAVYRSRGWMYGFEVNIQETPVFFTGTSFLIYPRPIAAGNINEAIASGLRLLDDIYETLRRWFPYADFTYQKELCRSHFAMIGGPTTLIPDTFIYRGERIVIDCSTGVPEIETVHKKYSIEDMEKIVHFLDSLVKNELVVNK